MLRLALLLLPLLLTACGNPTKDTSAPVEIEDGTVLSEATEEPLPNQSPAAPAQMHSELEGSWGGDFESAGEDEENFLAHQAIYWDRTNKINISLDQVADGKVAGHSVVAGNDRPFEGTYSVANDGGLAFSVREPGDDRYDGAFSFVVKDGQLTGSWEAYKDIEISQRKYQLDKKTFTYDPAIIRNTIYARHGYSFKNRPLRLFFDSQSWYTPLHAVIRSDFTELEKQNIKLLLKYETNAAEYYDSFGRG